MANHLSARPQVMVVLDTAIHAFLFTAGAVMNAGVLVQVLIDEEAVSYRNNGLDPRDGGGADGAGVMDKHTMRKFDKPCLTPVRQLSAEEIRTLRERKGAT